MWFSSSYLFLLLLELWCPALLAITFDKVEVNGVGKGANTTFYPYQYGVPANFENFRSRPQNSSSKSAETENMPLMENEVSGQRKKRQGKGQGESRTLIDFDIGPGAGVGPAPLCFEREVSGTCRYRTSPDECFRHEWTAYATIVNIGYKKITSLPEGLIVYPGGHARVRVFLKSSCCNPLVHFIATDLFLQSNVCIVDVRELQDLHPGEIVGIVIGSLLFIIILIAVIALCVRRQQRIKREKETVIFGRSLTASKSRSNSINNRS